MSIYPDAHHDKDEITTARTLSIPRLLLASTPLLCIAVASRTLFADSLGIPETLSPSLLEGIIRTIIQLSLLGSLLRPIFHSKSNSSVLVLNQSINS